MDSIDAFAEIMYVHSPSQGHELEYLIDAIKSLQSTES